MDCTRRRRVRYRPASRHSGLPPLRPTRNHDRPGLELHSTAAVRERPGPPSARLTGRGVRARQAVRVRQLNGVTRSWLLLPARAEAAVEGDVEGVEGCLPPVGPPLAALPGRVEAHEGQVEALEGGLLGGEVAA